jgi:hypothetical protein
MRISSKKNLGEFFALGLHGFYHENKRTGLVRAKYFGILLPTVCWATTDGKCGRTDDVRTRSREDDGKMRRATPKGKMGRQYYHLGGNQPKVLHYSQKLSHISSSLCLILLAVSLLFSPHLNQHKKEEEMNVGTNSVKDPRLEQKIGAKVGTEMNNSLLSPFEMVAIFLERLN